MRPRFGAFLVSTDDTIEPTWGTGLGTFTRASSQNVYDHEGVLRHVASGSIGITGSRMVTNLLKYSEDFSNAAWVATGGSGVNKTTGVTDPNGGTSACTITALGPAGYIVQTLVSTTGAKRSSIWIKRRTGTSQVYILNPDFTAWVPVTITNEWQRFSAIQTTSTSYGWAVGVKITTLNDSVDIAFGQFEIVTAASNQNPGEYVKTTSAAVTKCFSTLNGNTVDANGVVTEATGAALTAVKGPLLEVASTNKTTAYGIIPADTLGSELASGSLTIGQKYQITARTDADFTADGSANNTVGTQFVATAATVTLDAGDKVKRVQWGVGVQSFHNGTAFIQNITGLTLSGDTAAVLSIVTDETEITAAGLGAINPTYKVYKLDNSAGSANAYVAIAGTTGNTNTHSYFMIARHGAIGCYVTDNYSASQLSVLSAGYLKYAANNITPGGTNFQTRIQGGAGSVIYFLAPQLEEQTTATSYILTAGSTGTRAATSLSYPVAGNFGIPASIKFDWTLATSNVASERYLLGSYTDASNWFGILHDGTNLIFRKRVGGSNFDSYKALTPVAGTTYAIGARLNADYSTDVFVEHVKGTGNTGLSNEKVTNGGFDSDTVWTKGADWSIGSGVASHVAGTLSNLSQNVSAVIGRIYEVIYTTSNVTAGTIKPAVGGTGWGATRLSNGTWTERITCSGSSSVYFQASADFVGSIDNVSVKEVSLAPPAATTTFELGTLNGATGVVSSEVKNLSIYNKALLDWRM